jgi:hypothetical protein
MGSVRGELNPTFLTCIFSHHELCASLHSCRSENCGLRPRPESNQLHINLPLAQDSRWAWMVANYGDVPCPELVRSGCGRRWPV